jgi:hypothetical protein
MSWRLTKWQRSTLPYYKPDLHYTSTLLLLYNKDIRGNKKHSDSSDSDESGDDNILSKWQKLVSSLGSKTALSSHNRQLLYSPLLISDIKDDGSESATDDSNPTRTTPDVSDTFVSVSQIEP